ncbi:hypothetical protein M409DRAFT_27020 [Zasmidium cellare ATCC 36951]|uniref:Cytochrome P450 n=1 Tax=Zasmidium cellare ATCC 36951 TaxID=1080233 RepID=A0A6A6CA55_ZASCE|nr:uncharacterized protein M409DRAFT_27020 [Zasmidium cellare ATCC 36951]KAF2162782.1 hypothetical protein M409DRAFT_27020 [Zasmidium cellare ATCC 36951]
MVGSVSPAVVFLTFTPLIYIIGHLVYALYLSPYGRFPGPFWAKLTPLWLTLQCRRLHRSEVVSNLHKKCGDAVRIGPRHISIVHPVAMTEVYGHRAGLVNSPFYDARGGNGSIPAFSSRALSAFEPHMNHNILAFKNRLQALSMNAASSVNMVVETDYLAFDVIGDFACGQPFGFLKKGYGPFGLVSIIDRRGEVLNALGTMQLALRPWMNYFYVDGFWPSGLRARSGLEHFGRQAFQRRQQEKSGRSDLLTYLLASVNARDRQSIPEEEVIAEAISFIVGGSDTTSSTMATFFDNVARDQKMQRRLQDELDEVFVQPLDDNWVAPDAKVSKLVLLQAALREAMRVRPTSSTGLERLVGKGGKRIAGLWLPEYTIVSVPTYDTMHDAAIFPNPSEFDMDRWLHPESGQLLEHFVPFSTGHRACIGRK